MSRAPVLLPESHLVQLYESGKSLQQIAELTGYNHATVHRCLVRLGVTLRPAKLSSPLTGRQQDMEFLIAFGFTITRIAEMYAVSPKQVRSFLKNQGIQRPVEMRGGKRIKGVTQDAPVTPPPPKKRPAFVGQCFANNLSQDFLDHEFDGERVQRRPRINMAELGDPAFRTVREPPLEMRKEAFHCEVSITAGRLPAAPGSRASREAAEEASSSLRTSIPIARSGA